MLWGNLGVRFLGGGALRKAGARRADYEAENQKQASAEVLCTAAESRAKPIEAAALGALIARC